MLKYKKNVSFSDFDNIFEGLSDYFVEDDNLVEPIPVGSIVELTEENFVEGSWQEIQGVSRRLMVEVVTVTDMRELSTEFIADGGYRIPKEIVYSIKKIRNERE